MPAFDITILTESRYDRPEQITEYIAGIQLEDELLKKALERRGMKVARTDWANPDFDWSNTKYAIFRSTWDYFHRFDEFKEWLDSTSQLTSFINPLETILWNMDKHYLADMQNKDVNIPDTVFIHRGERTSLDELLKKTGWEDCILKPTVAGTARHTYRLNPSNTEDYEDVFQELIANEDMMLQVFIESIITKGEVSLVMIGGSYSHAVLKRAKGDDFRVQDSFGGTLHEYQPTTEEIAFAEMAMAKCEPVPLYARVDVMWDNKGALALGELELIEPELWFRKNPIAAELLAEVIVNSLMKR